MKRRKGGERAEGEGFEVRSSLEESREKLLPYIDQTPVSAENKDMQDEIKNHMQAREIVRSIRRAHDPDAKALQENLVRASTSHSQFGDPRTVE